MPKPIYDLFFVNYNNKKIKERMDAGLASEPPASTLKFNFEFSNALLIAHTAQVML